MWLDEDRIQENFIKSGASGTKCLDIFVYDSIDSTNEEAKRYWKKEKKAPCLLVSREQTSGHGRRGRDFYSPKNNGIYMSVLLKPKFGIEDAVHITTATAVIVARSLKKRLGIEVGIKWVNDLYLKKKKVCGILAEAIVEPGQNLQDTLPMVVGIGINFDAQNFPEELQETVGGVGKQAALLCNELIGDISAGLLEFVENMQDKSYMEEYRKLSIVLGKEIRYNNGVASVEATALDIDENGGLMVELADGRQEILNTGEITLRLKENIMK